MTPTPNTPHIPFQMSLYGARGRRDTMEDAAFAFTIGTSDPTMEPVAILLALDGVGGNDGGQVASKCALQHIATSLSARLLALITDHSPRSLTPTNILQILRDVLQTANERVLSVSADTPGLKGMATTVVCGVVVAGELALGHLGDSRCYLYRRGRARCLTEDHTITSELMHAGALRPEHARHHPSAHTITRFLGDPKGVNVDVRSFALEPEDVVVLTTDGCSDVLSDAAVGESAKHALNGRASFQRLAKRIVVRALRTNSRDNATAVCFRYDPSASASSRRGAAPISADAPHYLVEAFHLIKENGDVRDATVRKSAHGSLQ